MTDHADNEALSAFVDGEAPEWAAHVAGCPSCLVAAETLQAVQAAVSVPVPRSAPEARDRAIAAAVAVGVTGGGRRPIRAEVPARASRRSVRWMVPASIAAVLLLVVGAVSVLVRGGPARTRTTTAAPAPAPESAGAGAGAAGAAGAAAGRSSSGAGDSAALATGDLGEIPDAPTLLARARPGIAAQDTSSVPVSPSQVNPASPSVVGTRPCEEPARTRDPSLRQVVYFATAIHQGVPAVVLAFSTGPASVTLLMLAQADCAVLLRAAGP